MRPRSRHSWAGTLLAAFLLLTAIGPTSRADDLPMVLDVEFQPLSAQVRRVVEALDMLGQPLPRRGQGQARQGDRVGRRAAAVRAIQEVLDPLCLIGVDDQPREPGQGGPGPGRARAGAARLARLPGQGPQRGRRDGRAAGRRAPTPPRSTSGRPAAPSPSGRSRLPRSPSAGWTWRCSATGR